MAGDTFRETAGQYAPRGIWLRDTTSQDYLRALGGAVADSLALHREATEARFARTAPEDALPFVGDNRQLERAPGETVADYRLRLPRAFEIHGDRTVDDGYRHALEPLGIAPADVYVYGETEVGEHPDWYSEVFVFVDSTSGPWTLGVWDGVDDVWDDGGLWDLDGLDVAGIAYIRRTIRRYKWAGAYPVRLFAWLSGGLWTPGDAWTPATWHTLGRAIPILLGRTWDEDQEYSGVPDLWDDGGPWDDNFPETE